MNIRVGIVGYGNLGKGVQRALPQHPDMALQAIFTRRAIDDIDTGTPHVPVHAVETLPDWRDQLDVLLLCGGSASDLPEQTPRYAALFNVVDSFDNHAQIPSHRQRVDPVARAAQRVAIISAGWDPGLFSLYRLLGEAILPRGETHTFWGEGISQGHSDAIRRVPGVLDARQYTIPNDAALEAARAGDGPPLSPQQRHRRVCYVVAAAGANTADIEQRIVTMPGYFAGYETAVHFVSSEELQRDHSGMPHGGTVIRFGHTGEPRPVAHRLEHALRAGANPDFTASVLIACARAAVRLHREGISGCRTMLDIPPAYLSPRSIDDLIAALL